jgi:hypothetical protein
LEVVNLTTLHQRILASLTKTSAGIKQVYRAIDDILIDEGNNEILNGHDLRIALLELEHLGYAEVDQASGLWSITDEWRRVLVEKGATA